MRPNRCFTGLVGVLLSTGAALADPPVRFAEDIVPILKQHCAVCHLTGKEQGGLALHPGVAYDNLVAVPSLQSRFPRVKPGEPMESYLLMKLDGTHLEAGGRGARMPFGAPQLAPDIRRRIGDWIAAGAPRN